MHSRSPFTVAAYHKARTKDEISLDKVERIKF